MPIRFITQGSIDFKDHDQLANIGINDHATIDTYLEEIDEARYTYLSLGGRLVAIESELSSQASMLTSLETSVSDLSTVIELLTDEVDSNSATIVANQTAIDALTNDLIDISITVSSMQTDLDSVVLLLNDLSIDVSNNSDSISLLDGRVASLESAPSAYQEVVDARVDKDGVVYPSLKARLDSVIGGGGSVTSYSSYLLEHISGDRVIGGEVIITKGAYVVGTNELDVFLNGIRQREGQDYFEVDNTTVQMLFAIDSADIITVRVRDRSNTTERNSIITETVTTASSTLEYTLVSDFNTVNRILEVYRNGQLLIEGNDYVKQSNNTFKLLFSPLDGELLICQIVVTRDSSIKPRLIEYLSIDSRTEYLVSSFNLSVNDPTLEVFVDGVLLAKGLDYEVVQENTVNMLIDISQGNTLTLSIDNYALKSVNVEDFNVLDDRVSQLEGTVYSNMLTRYVHTFTELDWVDDIVENDYRINIPSSTHGKMVQSLSVTVYELVGNTLVQVMCDVSIEDTLNIRVNSAQKFSGTIVVI